MTPLLKAALELAEDGFPIHPLVPNAKNPLLDDWPEIASTDPDQIRSWWTQWPKANIGVVCGGEQRLLVVDVDKDKGGIASLLDLAQTTGHSLPATLRILTAGGGVHIWLRVPDGVPLPGNSVGKRKLAPGLDTRCHHGYVVAPPSRVDGNFYRRANPSPDTIAEAPPWLLERLARGGNGHARTDPSEWAELAGSMVPEGERNDTIARLAGKLFRHLPAADARLAAHLILAFNEARCDPPLDHDEVVRTLDSIASLEMRRRGIRP